MELLLTERFSGTVEAVSSTSQESQKSIQELLDAVQEFQAQRQQPPSMWRFDSEASTLKSPSDSPPAPPHAQEDEQTLANIGATRGFDLEIHSGPEALLARFRNGAP